MNQKIKLTLGRISTPEFIGALQKLRRMPLGKDAYAVAKSIRAIEGEQAVYNEAFLTVVKECGKETSPGRWEVSGEEEKKKAESLLAVLTAKDFEIYLDHKIKLPEAALAEFTAEDFIQLEELVEL